MRANEILNEGKVLRTEQGPIYENPSKASLINELLNKGESIRGVVMYDTFWVANAYDMIHADIAVNVGLSVDYATPEDADLFMITPRGENKFEVDIFGADITFNDLPNRVKQTVQELRRHGYRIQVVRDDRVVDIMEPNMIETATAGATAAGAVATVNQPALAVQRRTGPYMNHTVMGPDGKPIKRLGGKKKKKKKKESLNEYKMIRMDEGKVLVNPSARHMINLLEASKFDELRGLHSPTTGVNYVWDSGNATHDEVFKYLTEYGYEKGGMPRFIIWKKGNEYKFEGPREVSRNSPAIQKIQGLQESVRRKLNEGKLYKVRDIPVIEKPNNAQLENLANKSKYDSLRITLDNSMNLWAWPADSLTHDDVEEYMETYIDEDFEAQERFNFTLMRGKDGVVWRAFADNEIANASSFDTMMSMRPVERAIGQADFDSRAADDFWWSI